MERRLVTTKKKSRVLLPCSSTHFYVITLKNNFEELTWKKERGKKGERKRGS